ncbi:MAG: hypothetical protein WC076_11895 [Terrimicrobiaceae bacterium]|jgi:hypothetical protein|nr:hypothetical protein [Terrimicrobiaceae bacterium]
MKSLILFLALAAGTLNADVVRPAPEFSWVDSTGARKSSRAFLGRPVLLLVADSPRQWAFRSQIGQLQKMYERLAAGKIVCAAAFSQGPGIIRSNIPFVTAADGPRVSYDLQAGRGFAIAIIGKDGNLDYSGRKVLPVQRIYDILDNSYVVQKALRRP